MLIRITLIIAIVAGLAATALNFVKVKEVMVTTMNDRDNEKKMKETAQTELASTKKTLKSTEETLTTTKATLATTEAELKTMTAKADDQEKKATEFAANAERFRGERDAAQQKLAAWDTLGLSTDQVKQALVDLKTTSEQRDAFVEENKILNRRYTVLDAKYKSLIGDDPKVELPAGLKGKITAVDPKYDFVVLDIGGNQGVLERGEMLVNRNGKLIAKVRIFSVEATRSVANVLPGWKEAEVMEGDQVLY